MDWFLVKLVMGKLVNGSDNHQKINNCLECGMVMPDNYGAPDYCPGCQKKPVIQSKVIAKHYSLFIRTDAFGFCFFSNYTDRDLVSY